MFILNPQSGVPIYRQLVEQIRRMVASGQLPPGAGLPSVRDLAMRHVVNPMTVSRAYSLLEAEGLLVRHRGKSMTVARSLRAQSPPAQRVAQLESQVDQLVLAARQLDVAEADVVKAVRNRWEKADE